jgi:hypothetical protein
LPGARNEPLVFNVEETLDDGTGKRMSGKSAFGAAIGFVFSFGTGRVFVFSFCALDLLPKHEQSASVDDFFLMSDFGSITSFSTDFIGEVEISIAGTNFEVVVGTSSSNDGGDEVVSLDKIEIGSSEGN